MPSIKTHAFAIFESVEEAEATRQALWDVEWPEGRNNTLKPKCASSGNTFCQRRMCRKERWRSRNGQETEE